MTLAMTIIMILSFFWKEFDGEKKFSPVFLSDRLNDLFVIQCTLEGIRFPPKPVG